MVHTKVIAMLQRARVLLILLFGATSAASAETIVREFSGSGTEETRSFTVQGPWIANWRVWQDYGDRDVANIEIFLYDAATGRYLGRITEQRGDAVGDRLIDDSGRFHFRIVSRSHRWEVTVIDIDEAEARRLRRDAGGR